MEIYQYTSINDVPKPWRSIKGAKLSLDQINALNVRAHELSPPPTEETPVTFAQGFGKAKEEFQQTHHVDPEINSWVDGAPEPEEIEQ